MQTRRQKDRKGWGGHPCMCVVLYMHKNVHCLFSKSTMIKQLLMSAKETTQNHLSIMTLSYHTPQTYPVLKLNLAPRLITKLSSKNRNVPIIQEGVE